jgi:hypothetical protein
VHLSTENYHRGRLVNGSSPHHAKRIVARSHHPELISGSILAVQIRGTPSSTSAQCGVVGQTSHSIPTTTHAHRLQSYSPLVLRTGSPNVLPGNIELLTCSPAPHVSDRIVHHANPTLGSLLTMLQATAHADPTPPPPTAPGWWLVPLTSAACFFTRHLR